MIQAALNLFHMFKKVKDMNMMRKEIEDIKQPKLDLRRQKNYNIWDEKYAGWN